MFFRTRHIFLTHVKKPFTDERGMDEKQQKDDMQRKKRRAKTHEYFLHYKPHRLKRKASNASVECH